MDKIMSVFTAPSKVFTGLKEKPEWKKPLIIVLIIIALSSAFTVMLAKDAIIAKQEEAFQERGMSDEQIEQAKKFIQGPLPIVFAGIAGAIVVAVLLLLFAVVLKLLVPVFGGTCAFKSVFSVVSFSALIMVPAAVLKLMVVAINKSPYVTTSLALLTPAMEKTSFLYQFLAGFDFFIIWEMILVAIGISIVSGVKKQNAYILVFLVWFVSIFVGIGLGSLRGAGG